MNPSQWSTKAEADQVTALIGPLGGLGTIFVPEYAGPFLVGETPDTKFYHVHCLNGFTCNAGLVHQNIVKYGETLAKEFAKAEMKCEGRWVIG